MSNFSFPYSPYPQQQRLMEDIYTCIVNEKIGIFESPTGTGKTLSVICSCLTWLENYLYEMQLRVADTGQPAAKSTDWLEEQLDKKRDQELLHKTTRVRSLMESIGENINTKDSSSSSRKRPLDKSLAELSLEFCELEVPQVIYCSRTHSQISQFVREINKTRFSSSVRCVTLSSRRNYCCNSEVNRLTSDSEINDKCLDLIDNSKSDDDSDVPSAGCPYLLNTDRLSWSIMSQVIDLEDIAKMGSRTNSCPYYATRKAAALAHVISLPYSSLLSLDTREVLKIQLKSCIVIIDEAHNLPDAIISTSRVCVSLSDLRLSLSEVETYLDRYCQKLNNDNLLMVRQLSLLLQAWIRYLARSTASACLSVSDFLSSSRVYQINIPQICHFIEKFKFEQKLIGISNSLVVNAIPRRVSYLSTVVKFLSMIILSDLDGRVLISIDNPTDASMKYVLMSLSNVFEPILSQARSVILIGGTLQPFHDLAHQLFPPSFPPDRIMCQAYDHVVPRDNVKSCQISRGPNSIPFNFSFFNRSNTTMILELADLVSAICDCMQSSGGLVIFFSSYKYLSSVINQWKSSSHVVLTRIQLHVETNESKEVDAIISSYSSACSLAVSRSISSTPVLCCVMGGKLSEGINLSDEKSRIGMVVGLPYGDKNDQELKIRMSHMDRLHANGGVDLYQSSCMRLINQAVGRCIRHHMDYACLMFVDVRFEDDAVSDGIATWARYAKYDNFGKLTQDIRDFFTFKYNQSST